ncbi:hypothetical protein [Rhizobium sp. Rhizsp82]
MALSVHGGTAFIPLAAGQVNFSYSINRCRFHRLLSRYGYEEYPDR